jgi:hypothetical protein
MSDQTGLGYYEARRSDLLRGFARVAPRVRMSLRKRCDDDFTDAVIAHARDEFERLIPQIPYIGGRTNVFSPIMVANAWVISLYRAMRQRGKTAEDVAWVCHDLSDTLFRFLPGFALRLLGRLALSWPVQPILQSQARRSQRRAFPGDLVYEPRRRDDGEVARVFEECAVPKFYDAQGVEELKPYCNFFDVTYSRLMGMGLEARRTIGLGCETCELRYKHGRETPVPAALTGIFAAN